MTSKGVSTLASTNVVNGTINRKAYQDNIKNDIKLKYE